MHAKCDAKTKGVFELRKSVFYIDRGPAYIGYTNGDLWNGWATPYFTLEEAQKIQAEFSRGTDFPMLYDVSKDEFRIRYDDDEPYIWKGEDIQTVDGVKHLYGIGAYSHIWDELGNHDKQYLAQEVAEWLYEYDNGAYEDYYGNRDVVKIILSKLADIDTLARTHTTMNDESLDDNEIYSQLTEILCI